MKAITEKTLMATVFVLVIGLTASTQSHGQSLKKAKFWTIENNVKDRSYTIVRYYDENDEIVYEKRIDKKFIKLNKRDVKKLNKELAAHNEAARKEEYLAIGK